MAPMQHQDGICACTMVAASRLLTLCFHTACSCPCRPADKLQHWHVLYSAISRTFQSPRATCNGSPTRFDPSDMPSCEGLSLQQYAERLC